MKKTIYALQHIDRFIEGMSGTLTHDATGTGCIAGMRSNICKQI
jgi:hypothetical protein